VQQSSDSSLRFLLLLPSKNEVVMVVSFYWNSGDLALLSFFSSDYRRKRRNYSPFCGAIPNL
jgi:hypothetical protein